MVRIKEEWRDIVGYEGKYQASSLGRIKALSYGARGKYYGKEKILKPEVMKLGYLRVPFWENKKNRRWLVHRLVAEAFGLIKNRVHTKGIEINHIDGNPSNNKLSNLEVVNRSENILHAFKIGAIKPMRGSNNPCSKYSEKQVKEIHALTLKGKSRKEISKTVGVPISFIKDVRGGRTWQHVMPDVKATLKPWCE
jgi:hypothetical protein